MSAAEAHRRSRRVQTLGEESTTTAQCVLVGEQLRRHRKALGLEQKDVAARAGFSYSKFSRMEGGIHQFKEADIAMLSSILHISPEEREALDDLVAHASLRPWWQEWSGVASGSLLTYISFEEMAKTIRSFEPAQLPGLMQTRAYAHAVIEVGCGTGEAPRTAEEIDQLLELRMERIRRFREAPDSKRLVCVIDESALWRPFGSTAVMRAQMDHLIDLAGQSQYVIRVLPLQRVDVPVMLGQTTILEFREQALPNYVYSEHYEGAFLLQEEKMVDRRRKAFDHLRGASLRVHSSTQRLKDLRSKLYP